MSKPLVAPTRYVLAVDFGNGTQREFVSKEYGEPDSLPTPAPSFRAFQLYEEIDGVRELSIGWYAPQGGLAE